MSLVALKLNCDKDCCISNYLSIVFLQTVLISLRKRKTIKLFKVLKLRLDWMGPDKILLTVEMLQK